MEARESGCVTLINWHVLLARSHGLQVVFEAHEIVGEDITKHLRPLLVTVPAAPATSHMLTGSECIFGSHHGRKAAGFLT